MASASMPSLVRPQLARATGQQRGYGVLLLSLAAALLANTAIGPLGTGLVSYPLSASLRNQLIGLEVVTVLLVVPWCLAAGLLALRGRPQAALFGFAPAAYTAYMFIQYVLGPEYGEYRLVALFHVALVTLSGGLSLWAWSLSLDVPLPALSHRRERAYGVVLLALTAFVVVRYLGALAGSVTGAPIPQEFADARTFYWSIVLLDLGVVVPGTLVAGVALLRGCRLGHRAMYAATGWFALVPPSVAAMAVVMLAQDDPNASVATVIVLGLAALAFVAFAVTVSVRLLRTDLP
jgi:hypothetical protein